MIDSALRYDWYLQDNLSVYGRLGAAFWNMEKTQRSLNNNDATGVSPLGEVGVNYHFNPKARLSTGYQYIDGIGDSNLGRYDSHALLVSLTYTFGDANQPMLVETAPMSAVEETITIIASSQPQAFLPITINVTTGFDSARLNQESTEQLTEVSSVLNSNPQAKAIVVGYTDSTGPASYNQKLSEVRAQAVVSQLIELGVKPTQLEWKGEGESQPIANNDTAEGRAKNRRVEITIPSFQFQE
nr:hypothetical protein BCU50_16975 [Vibrio sp. 10N.286.46.E10]PMI95212.1 hypothetical protein BCU34_02235 [Vibrio sp. 10N.286.45.E10]